MGGQDTLLLMYSFREEFNDETYDEPVLEQITYMDEDDIQWSFGESYITFSPTSDISTVLYFHENDPRIKREENE